MDTPDVHTPDDIARVAAEDVRHMFERAGLRDIVRLANDVAANDVVAEGAGPLEAPDDHRASR